MSHLFFFGEVFARACSATLVCCTGIALSARSSTPFGITGQRAHCMYGTIAARVRQGWRSSPGAMSRPPRMPSHFNLRNDTCHCFFYTNVQAAAKRTSQRSLQDAPIFRLLLKVAVKGTHQCDFLNFWGSILLPTDHLCAGCVEQQCLYEDERSHHMDAS